MIYAVIMAGGAGTRFWPKSTRAVPKQFLNLFGKKTLLQETVFRLDGLISPENVMVITNADYTGIVENQLPGIPKEFVTGEPVAKNTAPCVAVAAAMLHKKDPDSLMVVLPADHRIGDTPGFLEVLRTAIDTAGEERSLVTIGIRPSRPETGYGYIRYDSGSGKERNARPVYRVQNFTEKPDADTAKQFLESGDYLWNSGMFIWKTAVILEELRKHLPEVYGPADKLSRSEMKPEDIEEFYTACPSVSIDYGIMEKTEKVHVVPGDFGWNDVGSWAAVHELLPKNKDGNATGDVRVLAHDATSSLVQSVSGKVIALVGVHNIAVVETENAILVVNLEKDQGVKEIVDQLKKDPESRKYL